MTMMGLKDRFTSMVSRGKYSVRRHSTIDEDQVVNGGSSGGVGDTKRTSKRSKMLRKQKTIALDELRSRAVDNELFDLRQAFRWFDRDGDGSITAEELVFMFKLLLHSKENVDLEMAKAMIKEVDLDGNGTIEFEEFVQMMKKYEPRTPPFDDASQPSSSTGANSAVDGATCASGVFHNRQPTEDELRMAFEIFDRNADGYIEVEELVEVMKCITGSERERVSSMADGSGEIFSDIDARSMMLAADANGDGKIDWNEFSTLFSKVWPSQ